MVHTNINTEYGIRLQKKNYLIIYLTSIQVFIIFSNRNVQFDSQHNFYQPKQLLTSIERSLWAGTSAYTKTHPKRNEKGL